MFLTQGNAIEGGEFGILGSSVPANHEVSFPLNLYPDGYSIGKTSENGPVHQAVLQDGQKLLHPYDRTSEIFFSAIESGRLPGDILDDIPCKFVNGILICEDLSTLMLRKVLKQVEIIKGSRSGLSNFEFHEVEAIDLQVAVDQYLQVRGTMKTAHDAKARFGVNKEASESTTKAWLKKMRTLFIRKSCGFSSRSVITDHTYKQAMKLASHMR